MTRKCGGGPLDLYDPKQRILVVSRLGSSPKSVDLKKWVACSGHGPDILYSLLDDTRWLPSLWNRSKAKAYIRYILGTFGLPSSDAFALKVASPALQGGIKHWMRRVIHVLKARWPILGERVKKGTRLVLGLTPTWGKKGSFQGTVNFEAVQFERVPSTK